MDRSDLQEQLATLFLRLNGYFTSGFIVHAPEHNLAEIDILAIRFPHNAEPEREVAISDYLHAPKDRIDILICEVKGGRQPLQFNASIRTNLEAVEKVLRWIGIFEEKGKGFEDIASNFYDAIQTKERNAPNHFIAIPIGKEYLVRGIFFAPDRPEPQQNQPRYIYGQLMVNFLFDCFCPDEPREECATRYDFGLWGVHRELVTYLKSQRGAVSIDQIYQHFGV